MSDIDYHAIAAKLRERNPAARDEMLIPVAQTALAIWALADALDAMRDETA